MSSTVDQVDYDEYKLLVTRANSYHTTSEVPKQPSSSKNVLSRNKYNLQCRIHYKQDWTKDCIQCDDCLNIEHNNLPNGKLPTVRIVIGFVLKLKSDERYSTNCAVSTSISSSIE